MKISASSCSAFGTFLCRAKILASSREDLLGLFLHAGGANYLHNAGLERPFLIRSVHCAS
jgi:hypothetical protein